MIWYWFVDFMKSRLGRVLLFCLIIAGVFLLVARHQKKKREASDLIGKLPSLAATETWSDGVNGRNPDKGDYAMFERREGYRPFRAAEPLPEQRPVISNDTLEKKSDKVAFVPLSPLITYDHRREAVKSGETKPVIPKPTVKLPIEEGALLHCRLVTPVTSGQGNAPVLAELTRPLIRRGRVLLPTGTRLSGKLTSVTNDRFFFNEKWRLQLPSKGWIEMKGQVQEAAYGRLVGRYGVNDGRAGLSVITNAAEKKKGRRWGKILGTVALGASQLARERTRTAIGEHIPSTVRNILLDGTSKVIGGYLEGLPKKENAKNEGVIIEGGKGFYLTCRLNE